VHVTEIVWRRDFETGIERIDHQHRALLQLIQSCHEAVDSGCELTRIWRTVDEVASYARFHFLSEENFMLDVTFPDLERHRTLHAELLRQLEQERADLEASGAGLSQFMFFLYDWFVSHTVQEDRKIARYLEETKAGRTGVRRIKPASEES